jgi:hypothetical protein
VSNTFVIANSRSIPTWHGHGSQADSIIDLSLFNFAATNLSIFRDWDCTEDLSFDSDHNGITWTIHPLEDHVDSDQNSDMGIHIDPSKSQNGVLLSMQSS